jgi:penicillin-binding protein 1C
MISKKKIALLLLLLCSILILSVLIAVFHDLPQVSEIPDRLTAPSIRITDRDGVLLYEILQETGGRNTVLEFEELPDCMVTATIAIEDQNFYTNPGIDLEGIVRALWINLKGGETIAGGSTITQQVARNLLLPDETNERTLRRKLREIVLAWQITHQYSKDEIIALYLNQMYYGGLAYGIEAASQTYFGKPAAELELAECALLAGLTQAPSYYNPLQNPQTAKLRQEDVLIEMLEQNLITEQERNAALEYRLTYNPSPYPILAPHFVQMIKDELGLLEAEGKLQLDRSMIVRTALDAAYQELAEETITRNLAAFQQQGGLEHHVNNAALAAVDPGSGEVLALVGSADYFNTEIGGTINMAAAPRQPGSAFKPFIYAAALDPGQASPWTAATPILDVTTTFFTASGSSYTPKNYEFREHGPVSVRNALGSSLNIPAVITLNKVGVEPLTNLAENLGITTLADPSDYDLSLALGGGTMNLLELTTAYTAFANQGTVTPYTLILDIRDPGGELLYQGLAENPIQVFDPAVAWLISDILSDDQARELGFGLNSILNIGRPAAVKTGTTTNYHDNWTVGYTPDLVVGVWVGNSDYQAMRNVTGLSGAAPIWHEFMRLALENIPEKDFIRPENLVQVEICAISGLLPTEACQNTRMEWFIEGTEPVEFDDVHLQLWLDERTGLLADETTPVGHRISTIVLDLPPEAHNWAQKQGLTLLSDMPVNINQISDMETAAIQVISPRQNATYQITSDYAAEGQQILIEIAVGSGVSEVSVWVDGMQMALFSSPPYQVWWPLEAGDHTIWAQGVNLQGETVTSEEIGITVLEPD